MDRRMRVYGAHTWRRQTRNDWSLRLGFDVTSLRSIIISRKNVVLMYVNLFRKYKDLDMAKEDPSPRCWWWHEYKPVYWRVGKAIVCARTTIVLACFCPISNSARIRCWYIQKSEATHRKRQSFVAHKAISRHRVLLLQAWLLLFAHSWWGYWTTTLRALISDWRQCIFMQTLHQAVGKLNPVDPCVWWYKQWIECSSLKRLAKKVLGACEQATDCKKLIKCFAFQGTLFHNNC